MGYIRPQYLFFLSVLKISLSFPGVWVYREKHFNGFRTRDCALKIGYEDGEFHEKGQEKTDRHQQNLFVLLKPKLAN